MLAEHEESKHMDGQSTQLRISVVPLQQKKLTFCDGSLGGLEAWAKKLPLANVGASAKLLFQAIKELNITEMGSIQRYKMLELIRGHIYSVCQLLDKRIMKQSVNLAEGEIKVVTLAQTLQGQLASGYKRIVVDEMTSKKKETQKVFTFAAHRAISDISQTILRSYQLYSPHPQNAWLELHQLHKLAQIKKVDHYSVKDSQLKHITECSIGQAYIRIMLVGTSKPNQLRQSELKQLFTATELWTGLVKITPAEDVHSLFVILPNKDFAPVYRSLIKADAGHEMRGLLSKTLVIALQKHQHKDATTITVPEDIQANLLQHVIHAWGNMIERNFRRSSSSGEVDLAIGLLSSHYFYSKENSFPHLLDQWNIEISEEQPQKLSEDVWDNSFDAGNNMSMDSENIAFDSIAFMKQHGEHEDTGPKGSFIHAKISNTSLGGYGMELEQAPNSVQTGELVVIREPGHNTWNLGSIRWIRSRQKQATQLGIELIAPNAEPVAVRILNKTGENGKYLRGLRLPALPAIGQEETLILPILPFKVGSKAELADGDEIQRIQLLKRQKTSRSFVQYSYQSLANFSQTVTKKSSDSDDDEFASIWDKL